MENKAQESQTRSVFVVLGFLISDAEETFRLLCRMNKKIITLEDSLSTGNNLDNLSLRDYSVCVRALRSHLCALIWRMFDTRKGTISFKTVEWFVKQPKIKMDIEKICREAIIDEIVKTRHTFISHVAFEVQDIISPDRICESNLGELLARLNGIYNLWLSNPA